MEDGRPGDAARGGLRPLRPDRIGWSVSPDRATAYRSADHRLQHGSPRSDRACASHRRAHRDGRQAHGAGLAACSARHPFRAVESESRQSRLVHDTDARFLYDDKNLYVGVRCFDPEPDKITVSGLEREFNSGIQDGIGLFFDSMHDGQTGFYFATNPVGAHHDFQSSADDAYRNNDWEGVWDVRVTIDDQGWIAEFIVPFKTLRFSNEPNQEWGLNIMRRIRRYNEQPLGAASASLPRGQVFDDRHVDGARKHPSGKKPEDQTVRYLENARHRGHGRVSAFRRRARREMRADRVGHDRLQLHERTSLRLKPISSR